MSTESNLLIELIPKVENQCDVYAFNRCFYRIANRNYVAETLERLMYTL